MTTYFADRLQLLKTPALFLHVLACVTGTMGMGLTYIAMTWTVANAHHSITGVAWLMAGFWLPGVLMSPLIGVIVDRFRRQYVVLASMICRGVGLVAVAYCYHQNQSLNYLYLLAMISGLCASIYTPAAMAFVREMVSEEQLLYANATIDMSYELGFMLGMQTGGLLLTYYPPDVVFCINAICFVLPILATFAIRSDWLALDSPTGRVRFGQDILLGFRYLLRKRKLCHLYGIQLFIFVAFMTTPVLLAPFVTDILHASSAEFGMIEAALSLGVVVGCVLMPLLSERIGDGHVIRFATFVMICAFTTFAFCTQVFEAICLYFVVGGALSSWALITTRAQRDTAINYQGRTQSTFNALSASCILFGFLIVGQMSHFLSVQASYSYIIGVSFCAFLLSLFYRF